MRKEEKRNEKNNRASHPRQSGHPIPWLDIVGPTTAVLTNMMGRRRMVTFRRRRNRRDGPWMRLAKRAVPMVIRGVGMWMVSIVVMMMVMGVEL